MFDSRPTVCHLCGGEVVYGKMTEFGIKPFQSGCCYICMRCNAYTGTHCNNPKDALGVLGTRNDRSLRRKCHEELDKHWMSSAGKNRAYYKLSADMGIKFEDCHFGHMREEQLKEAYDIMQGWGNLHFR